METIDSLHNYDINHNHGLVNENASCNLVSHANAGPSMVQSAEQPATPIQVESVVCERLVARVREMELRRPDQRNFQFSAIDTVGGRRRSVTKN
jgi:hypothetical protein